MFSFLKRKKAALGDLTLNIEYSVDFNFAIMVKIAELNLQQEIKTREAESNYGICRFAQIPTGRYTAVLEGYMSNPDYKGKTYGAYEKTYGKFEQAFPVMVKPFQRNVHLLKLQWNFVNLVIRAEQSGKGLPGTEILIRQANPNFMVARKDGEISYAVEPGNYDVVIRHESRFFTDRIYVDKEHSFFIANLDREKIYAPRIVTDTDLATEELEAKLSQMSLDALQEPSISPTPEFGEAQILDVASIIPSSEADDEAEAMLNELREAGLILNELDPLSSQQPISSEELHSALPEIKRPVPDMLTESAIEPLATLGPLTLDVSISEMVEIAPFVDEQPVKSQTPATLDTKNASSRHDDSSSFFEKETDKFQLESLGLDDLINSAPLNGSDEQAINPKKEQPVETSV